MPNSIEIGTTFSELQCTYLGFDQAQTREAFRNILSLNLNPIRLGSYWSDIEQRPGDFDFRRLDWLLNEAQKRNTRVALTVGIKAPRVPEFHLPPWITETLQKETKSRKGALDNNPVIANFARRFTEKVLLHIKDCKNITHVQVENEPLAKIPFAGNNYLSPEFLTEEINLARQLLRPDQKILINLPATSWPVPLPGYYDKTQFEEALKLADAVGVNVYPKVPAKTFLGVPFESLYITPLPYYLWNKLKNWQQTLVNQGKEAWITEAQAEPWEDGRAVHTEKREYPSSNPELAANLALRLIKTGYSPILLWGCEHWYYHKLQGHNEWWHKMEQLLKY